MGANLKEVRERIKSVISTQQITKAMKMVSAAKLRRAQQAIQQLRPYSVKLNELLSHVLVNASDRSVSPFISEREVQRVCIVVVTSNRGLAGAFNTNILKELNSLIRTKYQSLFDQGKVTFLPIGKKGAEYVKRHYANAPVIRNYVESFNDLSYAAISKIAEYVMDDYAKQAYDRVEIVYSRFKNAGTQFPESEIFLPVQQISMDSSERKNRPDYIFEPNEEELLEKLVPMILKTQFHKTVLDTNASEHGARMTAMDKATENAESLLLDMKIAYNKARQEAITKELSEIVSGAAALGN